MLELFPKKVINIFDCVDVIILEIFQPWVPDTFNPRFNPLVWCQDGRGTSAIVRVLGAAPHRLRTTLSCVCVDPRGYRITVSVDVRQNKEHWSLPYSSYYFNCMLRGNFKPSQASNNTLTFFSFKQLQNWPTLLSKHSMKLFDFLILEYNVYS